MAEWWEEKISQVIAAQAAAQARYAAEMAIKAVRLQCESPIEAVLAACFADLEHLCGRNRLILYADSLSKEVDPLERAGGFFLGDVIREARAAMLFSVVSGGDWTGIIQPQVQIGPYRADFIVVACVIPLDNNEAPPTFRMVVECDGHDHHDLSKEQAEWDRSRDRYMQGLGLPVFRFTGSQIWRDPWGCRREIERHVARWAYPFQKLELEKLHRRPLDETTLEELTRSPFDKPAKGTA